MAKSRSLAETIRGASKQEPALLGAAEAAELLGVERSRISRWLKTGAIPDPVARLKATPVWTREQITQLKNERSH